MENDFLILKITFLILENQRFSNIHKGIFNIRKSFSNINKGVATYFLILIKRAPQVYFLILIKRAPPIF